MLVSKLKAALFEFQVLGCDARPLHPLQDVPDDRDDDPDDLADVRHRLVGAAPRLEGPGLRDEGQRQEGVHRESSFFVELVCHLLVLDGCDQLIEILVYT